MVRPKSIVQRDSVIQVRVTPQELETAQVKAKKVGLSVPAWLRSMMTYEVKDTSEELSRATELPVVERRPDLTRREHRPYSEEEIA